MWVLIVDWKLFAQERIEPMRSVQKRRHTQLVRQPTNTPYLQVAMI
jgi:hypothetical protein